MVSHVPEIHRQISECGYGSDFTTFSGIRLRDICHRREISPTGLLSLLHIPVARYCDTGVAVGTRLQAHPSYSAETLPLDGECTTGPGYKNVIVLHAHARLRLRRTRESTRSIVISTNAFRLERDALSPRAHFIRERLVFPAFRATDEIDSRAIMSLANCLRIDVPSKTQNRESPTMLFREDAHVCSIYLSGNWQTRLLNDCLISRLYTLQLQ